MRRAVLARWNRAKKIKNNEEGLMASRSRPRSRARNCVSLAPVEAVRRRFLNVVGVSVEKGPQWRWRIVNGFGEILRESVGMRRRG